MKVLVTGSRKWNKFSCVYDAIKNSGATCVVHGGAKGADLMANEAAIMLNLYLRVYQADWQRYGKSAGTNRNIEMLQKEHLDDDPIDLVLAFPLPESIGTYHMIGLAVKAKIPIMIGGVLVEPGQEPTL